MKIIRKKNREYLLLPLAILAISTASIFIRFAQESMSSLVIATYRLTFASLILMPFMIGKTIRSLKDLGNKEYLLLAASGLFLAMHFLVWIVSLEYTSIVASVVLVTTTPIWVSIFSPYFTGDKPSRKFWLGLIVAMAGVIVISFAGNSDSNGFRVDIFDQRLLGNGLALLGAVCAAFYVLIGKIMRNTLDNPVYTFSVYSTASIALLSATILLPTQSLAIQSSDLGWLLLLALIPQLIGHSLINRFLGSLPAHEVSLFLLGEPVGSALLAMVLLQEIPTLIEVTGSVIILIGIIIAITASR